MPLSYGADLADVGRRGATNFVVTMLPRMKTTARTNVARSGR
jgi:hypothetical protein